MYVLQDTVHLLESFHIIFVHIISLCALGELAHHGWILLAGFSGGGKHVHVEHRRSRLSLQL